MRSVYAYCSSLQNKLAAIAAQNSLRIKLTNTNVVIFTSSATCAIASLTTKADENLVTQYLFG